MFRVNCKTALRNLWKNKTYSFLNIFGLAFGIACAALIFLWVADEVMWDNDQVKKDRLYAVRTNFEYAGNVFTNWSTPRMLATAMRDEMPGVVNTCRVSDEPIDALFTVAGQPVYAKGKYADSSIFSMFTLSFVQGNARHVFNDLYSIVLTESAVKKFFGNTANVIGRTVRMDNKQDYVVKGVIKDLPSNSTFQLEWIAPYEVSLVTGDPSDRTNWNSYGPITYVELNSSRTANTINKQLFDFIHAKDPNQSTHSFLFPMKDWHLRDSFINGKQSGGGRIQQVRMLSAIAWIILIIACINFMNLATARSEKRQREVGVRKTLGARKSSLIAQFMGEAFVMAALATLLSVLLIALALPAFNVLVEKQLNLHLDDPAQIGALVAIMLICGMIAGSYPSLYLSSFHPIAVLKGVRAKDGTATVVRKGLVVFQFAISIVFILSTLIIFLQIDHIKARNLGFDKDNLVEIDLQHDMSNTFASVRQDLLHTGVVGSAALADHTVIYGGNSDDRFTWPGKPADSKIGISFRNVSPEFISTCGMQLIEGKDFDPGRVGDNAEVIINESPAKLIGNDNIVGSIIQSPRGQKEHEYKNVTVRGVVKDYVFGNIYGTPGPVIFFCEPSENANLLYVRMRSGSNLEQALVKVNSVITEHNPAYPFVYRFVDDQFQKMFFVETQTSKICTVFASLAIIISCMGLFGLAAYSAERRTKEIGIRKLLGSSVHGIVGLLSKDFLKLVGISCAIGFPVAWWMMHEWLQGYEYRIRIHWWMFLLVGVFAMLIALFTVSVQAIKAALANPVKSLRTE